jgi:hypothetical protein
MIITVTQTHHITCTKLGVHYLATETDAHN